MACVPFRGSNSERGIRTQASPTTTSSSRVTTAARSSHVRAGVVTGPVWVSVARVLKEPGAMGFDEGPCEIRGRVGPDHVDPAIPPIPDRQLPESRSGPEGSGHAVVGLQERSDPPRQGCAAQAVWNPIDVRQGPRPDPLAQLLRAQAMEHPGRESGPFRRPGPEGSHRFRSGRRPLDGHGPYQTPNRAMVRRVIHTPDRLLHRMSFHGTSGPERHPMEQSMGGRGG